MNELYDQARYLKPDYRRKMEEYWERSPGTAVWKLQNFTKYVARQELTRFLLKYEIFKQVLDVQGSIIECGVLAGCGLMTWAHLSAIFEPLNYQRKVIGFDTFEGFTTLTDKDKLTKVAQLGGLALDSYDDIIEAIDIYDTNRTMGSEEKVILVRGDMLTTVPQYLKENPETVVSLLFLDVDVYAPTKIALEHFIPRMPKGSIVAFDELNIGGWPGETLALIDTLGINSLALRRFSYDTKICYAVL